MPDFARQVVADLVFDLDGVGFAANHCLPYPLSLTYFWADRSAQIVE
jgi:hypothetical protein